MGTGIHRFDFNALRDFRGPIVVNTTTTIENIDVPVSPPPPVFDEQDVESARLAGKKQGYNEGFSAGKLEAKKDADRQCEEVNETIIKLGEIITSLSDRYQQLLVRESQQLSKLATSIARKVAAEALDARGEAVILEVIERCLPVLLSKPRLMIEMNPNVFERTLERIENLLRDNGTEAEIQFRANPQMSLSDVRLDWDTGQIDRSCENLWREIDVLIARVPLEFTFDENLITDKQQGNH